MISSFYRDSQNKHLWLYNPFKTKNKMNCFVEPQSSFKDFHTLFLQELPTMVEYLIETIEDPLFVRNSPEIRRIIVLLGLNTYKNIPLNELVVSTDTIVKQKIQRLEDELTTLRSSFTASMITFSAAMITFAAAMITFPVKSI